MDLKEFISDTLTQICEGVKDAQENCAGLGALVCPPIEKDRVTASASLVNWKYTDVRFKVALQSSDTGNDKSGIGVLLANITVGMAKETSQTLSSATSVEFTVPVALPLSPEFK